MSKIATPNQRKAKLCANDTSTTDNTSNSYKTFCCSFDVTAQQPPLFQN